MFDSLPRLAEEELLQHLSQLLQRDRTTTVELLACIDEIDQRKLWAKHACPSMFAFCVERFHMSESMTSKRTFVARTARKFPVILEMLARGDLHLSGVYQLAKHLTAENHQDVLLRARHKTMRQIEYLIAEIAPKPDVPSRIVTLPTRNQTKRSREEPKHDSPAMIHRKPASTVTPLSPRRYKVQVTVSEETRDKLTELQELMSHQIPDGDPAAIVDRALDVLLEKMRKQKAALTASPRKGSQRTEKRTRAIPAKIQREVFKRDGGQCAFTDGNGNRCKAKRFIEFHHKEPYARGGRHDARNIELRCHSHNQYQAALDYGQLFMATKRQQRRPNEGRPTR